MGGKTSVSSSGVTIPPEVLARYNSVNKNADIAAGHNFNNYSTTPQAGGANNQFVAPMNAQENSGISGVNSYANTAQPYFGAATNTLQGAYANTQPINNYALMGTAQNAAPIGGEQINRYMSPYLNTVLGSESALLNQNNQQQQAGQMGTAIRSGAFGGDRSGIAAANLNQQQNLANANIYGNILNQGYGQALSTAQQQQQIGLAGANQFANIGNLGFQQGAGTSQQLAALGMGSQQAGLQGAQAQIGAGQLQQQTAQAENTALYNQFLQQQSYPFQISNFLAGIAEGTGALSGSTTTGQQPGGFFSDERLKHDAEVIGKTFDGQPIYKYKYKGDDRTQIGLMAQDVEHKHPEAVGLAAGYKTVDYDKATKHAAERGHFYEGGLVPQSMGGHVGEEHMGEGYERGGYAFGGAGSSSLLPPGMSDIDLQAYMGMGQPVGLGGLYGAAGAGNMPHATGAAGAAGYVPTTQMPVGHLITASLPDAGPSVAEQIDQVVGLGKNLQTIGKGGNKIYHALHDPKKPDPQKMESDTSQPQNYNNSSSSDTRVADVQEPSQTEAYASTGGVIGHGHYAYGGFAPGGVAGSDDNTIEPIQTEAEDPYTQKTHGLNIVAKPNESKLDPAKLPENGPSGLDDLSKVASIVGTAAMMFSDARLKHDAEVIGKTFDGQPIYKYKYKGDDKTQIGLMAQNVEHSHPNAVGLAGGYKTVDYDKATKHSAERGHFYEGGGVAGRHGYATDANVPLTVDQSSQDAQSQGFDVNQVAADLKNERENGLDVNRLVAENVERPTGVASGTPVTDTGNDGLWNSVKNTAHRFGDFMTSPTDIRPLKQSARTSLGLLAAGPVAFARALTPAADVAPVAGVAPDNGWKGSAGRYGHAGQSRPARPATPSLDEATVNTPTEEFNPPTANTGVVGPVAADASSATGVAGVSGATGPAAVVGSTGATGATGDNSHDAKFKTPSIFQKLRDSGLLTQENVIPFLTGLAAMGTAPTRSLGVALSAGVGAGAKSYMNQQQQAAEIKTQQSTTALQNVEAASRLAGVATSSIISDPVSGAVTGVRVFDDNNNAYEVPITEYTRNRGKYKLTPTVEGVNSPKQGVTPGIPALNTPKQPLPTVAAGATNVAAPVSGAQAPTAAGAQVPIYKAIPSDLKSRIESDVEAVTTNPNMMAKDPVNNPFTQQAAEAAAARETRITRNTLATALNNLDTSTSGKFAESVKNPLFTYINSMITALKLPVPLLQNADQVSNQEVISKIQGQLAMQAQTNTGGQAFREFQSALATIPGAMNSRAGAGKLISTMMKNAQRDIELDQFYNNYRNALVEAGAPAANTQYAGRGLEHEFSTRQDPLYARDGAALEEIWGLTVTPPGKNQKPIPMFSYLLANGGNVPPKVKDFITKRYGPEVLRYFGGG